MPRKTARLILAGLGNVGRSFLTILGTQAEVLHDRYGLRLSIVGAVDSNGAAFDAAGLDPAAILATKVAGRGVATLPAGKPGMSGLELLNAVDADLLLEATPVNLTNGQPGLGIARTALERGIHGVGQQGAAGAGLPGVGGAERPGQISKWATKHALLGMRWRVAAKRQSWLARLGRARIERIEAVLNGTTQGILRMMEDGASYADALAEMQRRGLAETDPTLDVAGWDAANKLVILANAVLRRPTTLADLQVEGIAELTAEQLRAATARGERILLLGLAEYDVANRDYRLSVRPTSLPAAHPLARMSGDEMGIVYYTDIAGRLHATTHETDPIPTAAAMLRDVLEITNRM